MAELLCDGCGQPASPEHIRRRIERLELATRFRPIHIALLFLAEAPPPRLEDYFYYPVKERTERTGLSRVLFDELMQGLDISPGAGKGDDACLAEFQKRNFFFADCLECRLEGPLDDAAPPIKEHRTPKNPFELVDRYAPTLIKRIQHSYKPKQIVLLSIRTRHLIHVLQQAGLGDRLLLHEGLPLRFPNPNKAAAQAEFRAGLAAVLGKANLKAKAV